MLPKKFSKVVANISIPVRLASPFALPSVDVDETIVFSSGFTESLPTFSTNDDQSPSTPRFGSPLVRRRSRRSSTDGDYDHVEEEEDDWYEDDDSDLASEEESVSDLDEAKSTGEEDFARHPATEGVYASGLKTNSTDDGAHDATDDLSSIPTIVTELRHARTTSDQSLFSPNFNVSFVDAISSPTRHRFPDSGSTRTRQRESMGRDRRGDDGRARFEVVVTDASFVLLFLFSSHRV